MYDYELGKIAGKLELMVEDLNRHEEQMKQYEKEYHCVIAAVDAWVESFNSKVTFKEAIVWLGLALIVTGVVTVLVAVPK